ncbi:hypothetical protein OIN60_01970 [Paenibacillus sp. P96]|uniref:Uncharacterized protein n=1 Tax=Paenibacillus zeirhizosphaerae TaxID=2987519 RepID=A0ABT9FLF8_9BACL|nr:hypothetical protein [Paenibacillus sp. P96]MDP4095558.1 hypothetical protein [Paenibacillus sp. P96]
MKDWNEENVRELTGVGLNQLTSEVDRILYKMIDGKMGKLGVAYLI